MSATTPVMVRVNVWIEDDTNTALRKLAEKANRPLAWEIRSALEDHVAKAEKKKR